MIKKILISFLGIMLLFGFFLYADVNYEDGGVIEIESGETYYHQWPDNPGKVLLLEWLLEAIENGYVEFDNEGHKTAFINKINAVIGTAHSSNWEGAYNKIETDLKKHARLWVVTESDKETILDILDMTSHMYADRTPWIETGDNFKAILFDALLKNYFISSGGVIIKIYYRDCATQSVDGIFIHHAECDWKIIYKFSNPAPSPK